MISSPDLPSSAAPPPKRKPGAPPGNTNAVKHGYYSARFGPRTPHNLDPSGLSGQIVLLKVYLYHLKKLSPLLDNIHDQAALLRVLCLAMSSLAHLMRLQRLLPGSVATKEQASLAISQLLASLTAGSAPDSTSPTGAPPCP